MSTNQFPGTFTKNDYAYAQLRTLILSGELAPGSRIDQGKLSGELGVSTTPLREAIRRLTSEGLVQLAAHRDARVTAVSADEAIYLLEVRESLDPLAAGLAAERRTDDELAEIHDAASALRPLTLPTGEPEEDALQAHRRFHRAIYTASHNPVLIDEPDRLWDKADRYRLIGLRTRGDSPSDASRIDNEHRTLVIAIDDRDRTQADSTMREHIRNSLGHRAVDILSH